MSGVRISHKSARAGMFTFAHNKRPYRVPYLCPLCGTSHKVKTYHVAVDSDGFAFVSVEVWNMMRRHGAHGFSLSNEVANPPAQVVGTAPQHLTVTPIED